jgi:predicted phosphoribosyltransferase
MVFANRREAGRRLAGLLTSYRAERPVVLGLPRGGVCVAYEVARELEAPLDVLVVRKLGAPGHPELAIGAVAPGVTVLDEETIRFLGVPRSYIEEVIQRERAEVEARVALFGGGAAPQVRGRTAIIVDDGIATGSTALAALKAVRQLGAACAVVAAPVCSVQARDLLLREADDVVCGFVPPAFGAVGYWYEDFTQTTDEEVRDLLARARSLGAQGTGSGGPRDEGEEGRPRTHRDQSGEAG